MAFLHMHLAARLVMGEQGVPLARGREALNGGYACYGLYRTQDDRWLAVGALEPKFFSGLCERLGRPELLEPGYDVEGGGAGRVKAELARLFAERPLAHWQQVLAGSDLCIEPVLEGDEVLEDAQHRARGLFVEVEDTQRGRKVTHLLTPLRLGDTPLRPPPALGQHSREILLEAGFSPEQLQRLGL